MPEQFPFEHEKFKDVVHYVVHYVCSSIGSDALGNTKLHKILYYSDVLRYLATGTPMTGDDYLRQRFGPTSRHLALALSELEKEQRVAVSKSDYYGLEKSDYDALKPFRSNRLSEAEIGLIDHMIGFVCEHTAHEISEFSHDEVWASVGMGQRIPYYASFAMLPAEVSDNDRKAAKVEAVRIAPLIEEERRAGDIS